MTVGRARIFNCRAYTGWDWVASKLLSDRAMARRIWRKLGGGRVVVGLVSGASYLVDGPPGGAPTTLEPCAGERPPC